MTDLEGRTAVVTGGTSGVGLAVARRIVARGARVLVTGRDQGGLDRTAELLGPRAVTVRSDTAVPANIEALAERTRAEFGEVDLLFVNAGITRFVSVADMTTDVFDDVFAVNARGAYFTVQQLAPQMRRGGGIVLTTSIANVKGLASSSAYAASKAAVRSMTRSFARELLEYDVRVNAVSPGPIDTGILERALPTAAATAARVQMEADNPMQRFGRPHEVAAAVLYLGFDATYTTGSELPVDGGASQL